MNRLEISIDLLKHLYGEIWTYQIVYYSCNHLSGEEHTNHFTKREMLVVDSEDLLEGINFCRPFKIRECYK